MAANYEIVINNKRIKDFYNNNKHISIEAVNIIILNLIETINTDMTQTITNTINHEILAHVKEVKTDVANISSVLLLKLYDINRDFLDNIKILLANTTNDNINSITNCITDVFITKIYNQLPKHDEINNQLKDSLNTLRTVIVEDLKANLGVINKNEEATLRSYFCDFENRLQLLQSPLYTIVNTHQENINKQLASMKESSVTFQSKQDKVMQDLEEFLNKYRTNSNYKGKYSEHMLESVLNKIYPTAEIINSSSSQKQCGDFVLKREGKAPILIENKNYDLAVQKEGVEKFIRDVKQQKCNGLFLSQHSGIQYKRNFFIEIEGTNVLVYLHHVEYSDEKIKTAIDIIDNLTTRINEIDNTGDNKNHTIRQDVLDKINNELQQFLLQKKAIIFNLKENNKKIIQQIEEFNLRELTSYLGTKFSSVENFTLLCEICNITFAKKLDLTNHKKKCKQ